MKYHPAVAMLVVWLVCIFTYFVLPYQIEGRTLTTYGFVMFGIFIACFCLGAFLAVPGRVLASNHEARRADFGRGDKVLMVVAVLTIIAFGYDIFGKGALDLVQSYIERSERANALLVGAESDSSIAFQLGFVLYPASYVFIVREIAFQPKLSLKRVFFFGLLPILFASLSMGGRFPLLYGILITIAAFFARRSVFGTARIGLPSLPGGKVGMGARIAIGIVAILALRYFVQVFFVRAETAGGVSGMFQYARDQWGVTFDGYLSGFFFSVLGEEYTYLVFIFGWYLVQGLVMSNVLFSQYDGPASFGIYGIDLAAALMRRINGDFVAERFGALLQLNTYGFLPSAFGSLYVDLFYGGLAVCILWGWLAGLVYRNSRLGFDPRWILFVPFVNLGIAFSLVNTPIGFANGLMIHFWAIFLFLTGRVMRKAPG